MLGIFGLRRCLDDGAAQSTRETHGNAVDIGAALFQNFERFGHVAELDSDFLQNGFGVILDQLQAFFVEYFEARNFAGYVRRTCLCRCCVAARFASAARAPASARAFYFTHYQLLLILSRIFPIEPASIVLETFLGWRERDPELFASVIIVFTGALSGLVDTAIFARMRTQTTTDIRRPDY